MDDNCGEWVESMGVASGWNLWVWLECIGVVNGWCCKEVYTFTHNITNPYSTCIALFLQQHPYFVHFKNVHCSLYTHIYTGLCSVPW